MFAQVITVNVVTAEPTTPAKTEPNTAWLITISGNMLPNHDTAFGTMIYPAEPIVKPSAQKIKIASPLDILYPSCSWTIYVIHHRAAPAMLINLIVNFYQVLIVDRSMLHMVLSFLEKYTIRVLYIGVYEI